MILRDFFGLGIREIVAEMNDSVFNATASQPANARPMPAKFSPAISGGLLIPEKIAPLVHLLRHEKVILDSDLAELYGVTTGRLNEAV